MRVFWVRNFKSLISKIDLGIYSLQAVLAVFGDQEPERISASGNLAKSGVDESVVIQLYYPDGQAWLFNSKFRSFC